MPNWCGNKMIVSGPEGRVDEFVRQAEGPGPKFLDSDGELSVSLLSFHQLVPLPDDALAGPYDPNGYEAEHEYWGVKWGACEVDREYEPGDSWASYRFETAWNYPYEFLRRASMRFPELDFDLEYEEPNTEMFGRIEIQNGITLRHLDWETAESEAGLRRELAVKREGELWVSLLPEPPRFGPLRSVDFRKLGEAVNKKFLAAATAVEEMEADGWICGVTEQWELLCVHREVKTGKELRERLETLGASWILAV